MPAELKLPCSIEATIAVASSTSTFIWPAASARSPFIMKPVERTSVHAMRTGEGKSARRPAQKPTFFARAPR